MLQPSHGKRPRGEWGWRRGGKKKKRRTFCLPCPSLQVTILPEAPPSPVLKSRPRPQPALRGSPPSLRSGIPSCSTGSALFPDLAHTPASLAGCHLPVRHLLPVTGQSAGSPGGLSSPGLFARSPSQADGKCWPVLPPAAVPGILFTCLTAGSLYPVTIPPEPRAGTFNYLAGFSTGTVCRHLQINIHNFRLTIFLQNQLITQRQKPERHPRRFLLFLFHCLSLAQASPEASPEPASARLHLPLSTEKGTVPSYEGPAVAPRRILLRDGDTGKVMG